MTARSLATRILAEWPVGVLSTQGNETIRSVPIVFALLDDRIVSPIDNKPKSGRKLARVRDLERNPHYTLLLQHYDQDWAKLWWLRITGAGECVSNDQFVAQAIHALSAKYPQYRSGELLDGVTQVLSLDIDATRAWAFSGDDWLEAQFQA